MTEFKRDITAIQYNNENSDYELYHATLSDNNSDLLLLVSSPDQKIKVMIPTHKAVMVANLEYFKCMFRKGSNWQENKEPLEEITDDGDQEQEKKKEQANLQDFLQQDHAWSGQMSYICPRHLRNR